MYVTWNLEQCLPPYLAPPVREERAGGREGRKGRGREGGREEGRRNRLTDRHTDRDICSANGVSIQPANTIYPALQKSSLSNLQILYIQLCKWCLYPTCKYYISCSANDGSIQPANTIYPALQKSSLSNLQILYILLCK